MEECIKNCGVHLHLKWKLLKYKIKKHTIIQFTTTWMEEEGTELSEVSQKDRDTYRIIL